LHAGLSAHEPSPHSRDRLTLRFFLTNYSWTRPDPKKYGKIGFSWARILWFFISSGGTSKTDVLCIFC
jgi:hypothetical protein